MSEKGLDKTHSPLCLAYMGDAVFELLMRKKIIDENNVGADKLHVINRGYVNAKAQASMYFKIAPLLTEQELSIMKRGRNAKSPTKAKNATITDYRHATGLEALFGYLFLTGQNDRLNEIFNECVKGELNEK